MTIAAFANPIGTTRQTVRTIIAGRSSVGAEMAARLAQAFQHDTAVLAQPAGQSHGAGSREENASRQHQTASEAVYDATGSAGGSNEIWCRWVKFWNLKSHTRFLEREISRRHCRSNAFGKLSVATLDQTVNAL
jgi:plasmid maintenance system antidote protein VapI